MSKEPYGQEIVPSERCTLCRRNGRAACPLHKPLEQNHLKAALLELASALRGPGSLSGLGLSERECAELRAICEELAEPMGDRLAMDAGSPAEVEAEVVRQAAARSVLGSIFCATLTGERDHLVGDCLLWAMQSPDFRAAIEGSRTGVGPVTGNDGPHSRGGEEP